MKPTLRIWLLGKSSKESVCFEDLDSVDVGAEVFGCTWADGVVFSLDETIVDPSPDLIAAKTSPFSSVPWAPDAFNDDVSNPCSVISNFAAGLILLTLVFSDLVASLVSWWIGFSSLTAEPLKTAFFTISKSAASSTLPNRQN